MTLHTGCHLKDWSVHPPKGKKRMLFRRKGWHQYESALLCGFLEANIGKKRITFLNVMVPTFAT
jgi:hypothetical protein